MSVLFQNLARQTFFKTCYYLNFRENRRFFTIINSVYGRKYTEKHEWVEITNNIGTVGITDYAQAALGDIVYAQLPEIGNEFSQLDECGALESVKAASELYCPVSGKITEINSEIEEKPFLINQSCYGDGWLFKVELTQPEEVDKLLEEEDYNKFVKEHEN